MSNKFFKTALTGILAMLISVAVFAANVTFNDGSISKTFPTKTLYKHRVWGKWTMDSYARISDDNGITNIDGRTKLRSSRVKGFTGGVFIDLKDERGNVIDRISARTNRTAHENDNGKYVGWGVNGKKTRYVNWEITVPSNINYLVKSVDVIQVYTPKKIDWDKTRETFKKIANNLKNAVVYFFQHDGAKLIVKYAPDFVRMNNEAQAGTLKISEVLSVMNEIAVDAKDYGMISSDKACSVISIVDAVSDIANNSQSTWNNPEVQAATVAFFQNIMEISDNQMNENTLFDMLNQFETILNTGSNYTAQTMQSVEVIAIEMQNLLDGKLNQSQYAALDSFINIIEKINDYKHTDKVKAQVECAFDFTKMGISLYNEAKAGTLTSDSVKYYVVNFLNTNYSVLGLDSLQYNAIENIIDSLNNIINNGTDALLPANQEKLVVLVIDVQEIAASKTVDYALINKLVDDLQNVCNSSKSDFVSTSFGDFLNIVENLYSLVTPKLEAGSNADVVFNNIVDVLDSINNLGPEAIVNNTNVIFNGIRLVVNLAQQAQDNSISSENVHDQLNSYWNQDLYPALENAYPNKVEQIQNIKANIDMVFNILSWNVFNI